MESVCMYRWKCPQVLACVGQAGDALFVPEGWWHQVSSEGVTIAVNFWWRSAFHWLLGGHMDAYYLRRLASSLMDRQRGELLHSVQPYRFDAKTRGADVAEPADGHRHKKPAYVMFCSTPPRLNTVDEDACSSWWDDHEREAGRLLFLAVGAKLKRDQATIGDPEYKFTLTTSLCHQLLSLAAVRCCCPSSRRPLMRWSASCIA